MKKRLTHSERAARRVTVAADVARGEDMSEVARRHNLGLSQIRLACVEAGVKIPRMKAKSITSFQILAALMKNRSQIDIAAEFGISRQRVHQIEKEARKAGIDW